MGTYCRQFVDLLNTLVMVLGIIALCGTVRADPTTQPLAPSPEVFVAKVDVTPHFFQGDPRWETSFGEEHYCVPVSVSNAMVYFGENGFPKLLPDESDKAQAQAEIISTLVSSQYMATDERSGTDVSRALRGIRKYVEAHGYRCARLEYAGWRSVDVELRNEQIGTEPDLDWIKAAIAAPNAAAFLEVGHYNRGSGPNVWQRMSGHTMLAVGYGTDGTTVDPHSFIMDNSAVKALLSVGPRKARHSRPLALADMAITLTRSGPIRVIAEPGTGDAQGLVDSYRVTGRGMPELATKKYDATFLDGAIVLVIGK